MLIDSHTHVHFPQFDKDRAEVIKRSFEKEVLMINVGTDLATSQDAINLAEKHPGKMWATVGVHPNDVFENAKKHYTLIRANEGIVLGNTSSKDTEGANGKSKPYSNVLSRFLPNKLNKEIGIPTSDKQFNEKSGKNIRVRELIKSLGELAAQKEVVAIGETGLDFFRTKDKDKQKLQYEAFEQHIALANEVGKPLTIHIRDAYKEAAAFLKQHRVEKGAAMHCFGGTTEEARAFLDLGFYISFAGNITYSDNLAETIKYAPLDRLLVETDAPYLAPVPHRGQCNEPAYVEFVVKRVAQVKEIPLGQVVTQTVGNTRKLFKLS